MRASAIALLLTLAATAAVAQTGRVEGVVTLDGQGVPGVTVTIKSIALGTPRVVMTDAEGRFHVDALRAPATYEIKTELAGVVQAKKVRAYVTSGDAARVAVKMRAEMITISCPLGYLPVLEYPYFFDTADLTRIPLR